MHKSLLTCTPMGVIKSYARFDPWVDRSTGLLHTLEPWKRRYTGTRKLKHKVGNNNYMRKREVTSSVANIRVVYNKKRVFRSKALGYDCRR